LRFSVAEEEHKVASVERLLQMLMTAVGEQIGQATDSG
jgi:hypothetical protein